MGKKLERMFRDRHLTPEEVAGDEQVRRAVENEYPPSPAKTTSSSSLSEWLKRSIRESTKSVEEIAMDTGVSSVLIARFLSGDSDIHVTTADKLAGSLGLKLTAE
jgi:hypothetical protein